VSTCQAVNLRLKVSNIHKYKRLSFGREWHFHQVDRYTSLSQELRQKCQADGPDAVASQSLPPSSTPIHDAGMWETQDPFCVSTKVTMGILKRSCNVNPVSSPSVATVKPPEKFPFEVIAKGVTYALPFVYVCGFVVLSLFEADYGIADFSLVRVKALAAGLLFVFFIAYPALVSIRSFQLFGMKKQGSTLVEIGAKSNLTYFYIIKISEQYILSVFMSMTFMFFFFARPTMWLSPASDYRSDGHFSLLMLSVTVVSIAIFWLGIFPSMGRLIAKNFASKPRRCAVLIFLISVLWVIWTFQMSDRLFFEIVGWCYLVGIASILAAWLIQKGEGIKARDWEVAIFLGFVLLVPWFATGFYGNIKPAFGGGHPIHAKLYLKEDNPVFRRKEIESQVVEETQEGYYVLLNPIATPKTAVFIPRSSVSTAQFGTETVTPSRTTKPKRP
jgi:hypothetical protein